MGETSYHSPLEGESRKSVPAFSRWGEKLQTGLRQRAGLGEEGIPPSQRAPRRATSFSKRGFSLVELLVALTVLAVVSVTVFARGGDTLAQLHGLEQRTLARWVAENEVSRMRLDRETALRAGNRSKRVDVGERSWRVETALRATDHDGLWQVTVEVRPVEVGVANAPVDTLVAFVGEH